MQNKKSSVLSRYNLIGILFILPSLLAVLCFSIYPVIESLRISFQHHNGVFGTWIGIYNYKFVLSDDAFWNAMINTLYMGILTMVFGLPISLVVASLINNCKIGKNFFKSVFFLPNVTSLVSASLVFMFLFYPDETGVVNAFLSIFKIEPLRWFASPSLARIGIVIMGVWHGLGYSVIIWLSGLQSIPNELYEASEIDGASKLKQWRYITVPCLAPITTFMIIINSINLFKRFTDVYIIGGEYGVPGSSLMTLILYIYKNSFLLFDFGKASAASYIMFICIFAVTLINYKVSKEST